MKTPQFTRLEANEAIRQAHLLRKDIDLLLIKAMKALRATKPELRVIDGKRQ